MSSFGIVGAGVVGLRIAHRLAQAGHEVTVYDAAPTPGGLVSARAIPIDGGEPVTWDRYYHVVLADDRRTRALLAEIGLGAALDFRPTTTGYAFAGRVRSISSIADFLRLPGLGPLGVLRVGATIALGSLTRDGAHLDAIPARDWLERRSGSRAYQRFWAPQLRAKLGDAADETAASFIVASIRRLAGARKASNGREQLGWIRGGYARVVREWTAAITATGVRMRLGAPVVAVRPGHDGRVAVECGGDTAGHDEVVVTVAAPLAATLVDGLAAAERNRLAAVRSVGVVCLSLVLRRPLTGCYVTYLAEAFPFTAIVEMTALVDPSEVGGHTLVYLPRYAEPDDPLFERPAEEIRDEFVAALTRLHPQVGAPGEIVGFDVARARHVFAAPLVGSAPLTDFTTSVPGVHLCGSAHIARGTLNVDESLRLADRFVASLQAAAP